MELWINIGFAWVAVILSFLLVVVWGLRLICKKKKIAWVKKLNCALRRHHKLIGILLIAAGLVHGLFSSDVIWGVNWGTAVWIVSILLGVSWLVRKKLNPRKWWMYIHRILTGAFAAILVIHVLNVGGVIIDDMIAGRIKADAPLVASSEPITTAAETQPAQSPTPEPSTFSVYDILPTLAPDALANAQETTEPLIVDSTPTDAAAGDPSAPKYYDGTYQGVGEGFRPGLVVEVVIENDMIVSVTVIDHNEQNERYWGTPVDVIPQRIVDTQSTDVDTISGATWTSVGIIGAVNDALSQALR